MANLQKLKLTKRQLVQSRLAATVGSLESRTELNVFLRSGLCCQKSADFAEQNHNKPITTKMKAQGDVQLWSRVLNALA